ncbi:MAG: hypothetical protein ACLR6I_14825 [Waltera sp.]
MKVEVLASVMNASLPETVQHMNLQSDAVIINQCDRLGQEEMQISPGTEESVSAVFPTVASAEAAMRPSFGRKGTSAFFGCGYCV